MRYWQHLGAKTTVTHSLLHSENVCQWSVNKFWSCICGNRGIARIFMDITEPLTALIGTNKTYERNNPDFKIIDIANCKTCNNTLLAVEYAILIRYYYQTATTRAFYESIDGPAGWPAENTPNVDVLGDFHRTVPELTVRVNWQPGLPIWQQFGLDPNVDPKWWSATVAHTTDWQRWKSIFWAGSISSCPNWPCSSLNMLFSWVVSQLTKFQIAGPSLQADSGPRYVLTWVLSVGSQQRSVQRQHGGQTVKRGQ